MDWMIALSLLLLILLLIRLPFLMMTVVYLLVSLIAVATSISLVWLGIRFPMFGIIEAIVIFGLLLVFGERLTASRLRRTLTRPYRRRKYGRTYKRFESPAAEPAPALSIGDWFRLQARRLTELLLPAFTEKQKVRKLMFHRATEDFRQSCLTRALDRRRRRADRVAGRKTDNDSALRSAQRQAAGKMRDQAHTDLARQLEKLVVKYAGFNALEYACHGDVAVIRIAGATRRSYTEFRIVVHVNPEPGPDSATTYTLSTRLADQTWDRDVTYHSFREVNRELKGRLRQALASHMHSNRPAVAA